MIAPEALLEFINATAWQGARFGSELGDASSRQYIRLIKPLQKPALLMIVPDDHDSFQRYIILSQHLAVHGFKVPEIYETSSIGATDYAIIEDLGDLTFAKALNSGHEEKGLYMKALKTLLDIQSKDGLANIALKPYDRILFIQEAKLFSDWYAPAILASQNRSKELKPFQEQWETLWQEIFDICPNPTHPCLTLRDFHVENIMLTGEQEQDLALLDYQDAVIGPAIYDFISLIEDARRKVSKSVQDELWHVFLNHHAPHAHQDLKIQGAIWAAQRHVKVIGIFHRLAKRDNKPHYLNHVPHVKTMLHHHLTTQPILSKVAQIINEYRLF